MDQLATHSTGHLFGIWISPQLPVVPTRFEGHNYLTAVHVRIICFAIVIRVGMINVHNHPNACVVIFWGKLWHPTLRHLGTTGTWIHPVPCDFGYLKKRISKTKFTAQHGYHTGMCLIITMYMYYKALLRYANDIFLSWALGAWWLPWRVLISTRLLFSIQGA